MARNKATVSEGKRLLRTSHKGKACFEVWASYSTGSVMLDQIVVAMPRPAFDLASYSFDWPSARICVPGESREEFVTEDSEESESENVLEFRSVPVRILGAEGCAKSVRLTRVGEDFAKERRGHALRIESNLEEEPE